VNAVRYKLLRVLEDEGDLAARALAERVGASPKAVGMVLMRARLDGLVRHRRRTGMHGLSERGRARLAWLRGETR
jgi:predicted ArsR family transcriptional regulator